MAEESRVEDELGIDKMEILRRTGLFASLSEPLLQRLAASLAMECFAPDELIVGWGEVGQCMYIIVSGRVRVHQEGLFFNFLEAGAVFGEMAVLDNEARSASITAVERTVLLRLDQEPLYGLMSEEVAVARTVIGVLCRHLRGRVDDITRDLLYQQQFNKIISAAQSLEQGAYDASLLEDVAVRTDDLGHLARVLRQMAREVNRREEALRAEIDTLRIDIDEEERDKEVERITETDYFRFLEERARELRHHMQQDLGEDGAGFA